MKGFIEVNVKGVKDIKLTALLSISHIRAITLEDDKYTAIHLITADPDYTPILVKESYEEIKRLIEQAQEG